jgi:Fe2+ transport system protein FeoA
MTSGLSAPSTSGIAVEAESAVAQSVVGVPLTTLAPGSTAVLQGVGDPRLFALLRSLGLTGRAQFRLCRVGDPCIIQVRSTRIGLSKAVAESVLVGRADGVPM